MIRPFWTLCVRISFITNPKTREVSGNLSEFVAKVPAAAAYYRLEESSTRYAFPAPGRLEGINSTTKAILKLDGATFTWPVGTSLRSWMLLVN